MPGNAGGREPHDLLSDPAAVEAAAEVLRAGGAVVLPTDTVYGVAVLLSTPGPAQILSELKARSSQQSLAVLVASTEQAMTLTDPLLPVAQRLTAAFWPGPLTLVLRRRPELRSVDLGGDGSTIGVRCPAHPLICVLAARLGPIVTTSANRHGQPTPDTAAGAAGALAGRVDAVLDGGVLAGAPSTVVDCLTATPRVLREGALAAARIRSVAEGSD